MRKTMILMALAAIVACAAPLCCADANYGTESSVKLSAPLPADSLTVAIIADRTSGDESGLAVLEQTVAELNLLKPDIVVHIGDLVPGYTRDLQQWERDIGQVKAILKKLEPPFFPIPGNHDVITGSGNVADRRGEDLYKKHFGPLYYSFDCRYAHFVCLDTAESLESAPRFSEAQLKWLREDLARTSAQHIFVFLHKPVWEYPAAGWDVVHDILKQHPVRAVVAGHFHHYYKSDTRDGIQYYVLGATGGQLFSPELAGGLEHYCLLRVTPDGYKLALVKPGHILPDDYIVRDDYKDMEKLRNLPLAQVGVAAPVRSPELGQTSDRVAVFVTNPLARPLSVTVRGRDTAGWKFSPTSASTVLPAGQRQVLYLALRSAKGSPEELLPPAVDVQFTYTDSKGRTVPIVLERRIPLARQAVAPEARGPIALDGRADERAWAQAPVLTTVRWVYTPYEKPEPGPTFRLLSTPAGLYFYASSPDTQISDFRGDRILSDAIFLGALPPVEQGEQPPAAPPPVVIIFPFGAVGPQALRALWDPRSPAGTPAAGVHVATAAKPDGTGWQCEGFVPWDDLLLQNVRPGAELRFNIGAWDNDGDLFSELYSWAPTYDAVLWGKLTVREASGQ